MFKIVKDINHNTIMKTNLSLFAAFAIFMTACSSNGDTPVIDDGQKAPELAPKLELTRTISLTDHENTINTSINQFSFKFLNQAALSAEDFDGNDGNIAVSPLSTSICLAMVANSGDRESEKAIANMLGEVNLQQLNSTCNKLMRFLPSTANGAILTIANSAWYNTLYTPSGNWAENLASTFGSHIKGIEFADKNVALINNWCSENTNGHIPSIIDRLRPEGVVHLLNALYFQGKWIMDFDPDLTDSAEFNGEKQNSEVKMMHATMPLEYASNADFANVSLPFYGNSRIVFVMPSEEKSATELAKTFSYTDWRTAISKAKKTKVNLSLPKFKADCSADISDILYKLGLPEAFDLDKMEVKDQFGRILNGAPIVHHKTSVSIEEKGAEAAAITDAEIVVTSPGDARPEEINEVTLTFDRPFLYFIENTSTGSILIAGIINNL